MRLSFFFLAIGCGSSSPFSPPAAQPSAEVAPPAPRPNETAPEVAREIEVDFGPHFAAEGVEGAAVFAAGDRTYVYRPEVGRTAYLPASTFKITNTIIALETGVAPDLAFALRWDGTRHTIDDWNRDHTLATAFRSSVVWFYQELARRIGAARMQQWLDRLEYGNRSIEGGIDRFWLDGGMRISPLEQVAFVRRLERGELPIEARTRDLVRRAMILDETPERTLCGKTGWAIRVEPDHGWFVGWEERGDERVYFATLVIGAPEERMLPARRAVTERILTALAAD
jgi:beta-lactamase class D